MLRCQLFGGFLKRTSMALFASFGPLINFTWHFFGVWNYSNVWFFPLRLWFISDSTISILRGILVVDCVQRQTNRFIFCLIGDLSVKSVWLSFRKVREFDQLNKSEADRSEILWTISLAQRFGAKVVALFKKLNENLNI